MPFSLIFDTKNSLDSSTIESILTFHIHTFLFGIASIYFNNDSVSIILHGKQQVYMCNR